MNAEEAKKMDEVIWNGPEKRRYGRIELALTMHHRLCVRDKAIHNEEWEIAIIEDIGLGGLRFSSHIRYKINDVLQIQIEIIDIGKMFKCSAKTLRMQETLYKLNYSTAVEFISLHHEDVKDIKRIIEEE